MDKKTKAMGFPIGSATLIVVTDPQTNTNAAINPQTGLITIHCTAKLSTQCNDSQKGAISSVCTFTFINTTHNRDEMS